jgi:hypothetical protein
MIVHRLCTFLITGNSTWVVEWVFGLPLTVVTVLIHTSGLWMVRQTALQAISQSVLLSRSSLA